MYSIRFYIGGQWFSTARVPGWFDADAVIAVNIYREIRRHREWFGRPDIAYRVIRKDRDVTAWFESILAETRITLP